MKNLKNWTSTAIAVTFCLALIVDVIWTSTGNWLAWVAYFGCIAMVLFNLRGMVREIEAWKKRSRR